MLGGRIPRLLVMAGVLLAALPVHAAPAAPIAGPVIGVVKSKTVYDALILQYGGSDAWSKDYYNRVDSVYNLLVPEFVDVSYVGDDKLNSSDPNALAAYDVLVFPRHTYMTQTQRFNVREYVARGGSVVLMWMLAAGHYTGSSALAYKDAYSWGVPTTYMNAWRWGETSELHMTRFINDGYMYAGYKVLPYAVSSHQILQWTDADLRAMGYSGISITAKRDDFPETVATMKGVALAPLLKYDTKSNAKTGDDAAHGTLAGWAAGYYFGRIVYFPFQLYDFARSSLYGDAQSQNTAKRLIVNSVKWAAQAGDKYGHVRKHVGITGKVYAGGRSIYVQPTITNDGSVQLNGTLKAVYIDPTGKTVYTGTRGNVAMPAGYTFPAESVWLFKWTSPSAPRAGTWTVRYQYVYHDIMKGGWVTAQRDARFYSNGSSFAYKGMLGQVDPSSGQPAPGDTLAGATRYDTAAEIAGDAFPAGLGPNKAVILASGLNFNDALASAGLSGKLGAPILLVPSTYFPTSVGARLAALYSGESSATLWVIGDTSVVPAAIADAAKAAVVGAGVPEANVTVRRLGSGDAYSRAAAIAREVGLPSSGPMAGTVVVATGSKFADALSVSPLAVRHRLPILFVSGDTVPQATRDALAALGATHTIIVGGTAVVGAGAESWLESNGYRGPGAADNTSSPDSRLWGATRYDTCLAILDATCDPAFGGFDDFGLVLATGTKYPDALAGGVLCEVRGNPILLVNGDDLGFSTPVAGYLHSRRDDAPSPLTFLGGTAAVGAYTKGQVGVGLKATW